MTHKMQVGLELIVGPMFSGKTTELARELVRAREIDLKVLYINHSNDTRNPELIMSTHNPILTSLSNAGIDIVQVPTLSEISLEVWNKYDIIGIDEAQFFPDLTKYVTELVDYLEKKVYVVGLDGTFQRKPFGQILDLVPYCNTVRKLSAYCKRCHEGKHSISDAIFTHRFVKEDLDEVSVGGADKYEALCRSCYNELNTTTEY